MKKIFLMSCILILVSVSLGFAGTKTVTLTWTSNTEEDMAGYEVYRSINSMASNCDSNTLIADVPHEDISTHSIDVDFTIPDGTEVVFYLRVLAKDTSNNKSECSNEVSVRVDEEAPSTPGDFDATLVDAP